MRGLAPLLALALCTTPVRIANGVDFGKGRLVFLGGGNRLAQRVLPFPSIVNADIDSRDLLRKGRGLRLELVSPFRLAVYFP